MRRILFTSLAVTLCTLSSSISHAQGVAVGSTAFTPVGSAMLEMRSTSKGFLMPRMTEAQRDAIVTPATGLMIFQTDNAAGFYYYDGAAWLPFGGADNLGNHRATQNVRMNNNWLSGDGDPEGIFVAISGNVGVGTGSPTKLLQVETSNNGLNVPIYLRNTNNAQAGGNAVGLAFVNEGTGTFYKGAIVHERLGNFGIGSMHFLNNGNGAAGSDATLADARMTIQSNGNVGINKTTPSDLLDVAGGNVRVSSSGGTAYGLVLQNPAGTFTTTHKAGAQGANITYTWPTTAPALNQVLQSDASGNLSWTNASSGWGLTGNTATNPAVNYLGTTDGQPLRLATAGTERLRINAGAAEVGIGMTAGANNSLDIANSTSTGRGVNVTANSLTTGTAISATSNGLTSGSGLSISSGSTGFNSTNGLANVTLSGNNAANTGTVFKAVNSGINNSGTTLMATNAGTGLTMRLNDDGTDADATPVVVDANGQMGIGTALPNSSALLDISAANKGIRIPNVALTGTTDAATIASPAASLLVYNTATAGIAPNDVSPGYYYNSGTPGAPVWTRIATGSGFWGLTGNSGTNPALNYIGTSDAQPLRLGTTGSERVRINAGAAEVGIGMTASPNNSLDITNSTASGTGVNVTANSLTNGSGLKVASTATAFTSTNGLGNFTLSGNNAANTGTVLKVVNSGSNNTGTALMVTNAANSLAMRINDDGTDADATPFVVSADGNTGIGTAAPTRKLHVVGGDNSSSVDAATTNVLAFLQNTTNNGSAVFNVEARTAANVFASRMGINPTFSAGGVGPGVYAWYAGVNGTNRQIFMYDYVNFNLHLAPTSASINNVAVGYESPTIGSKLTVNGGFAISNGANAFSTTTAPLGGAIIEGNVGIGTVSPVEKLTVNDGHIRLARNAAATGEVQWQGTGAGITSIKAGAQGATNISYTWPLAPPAANGAVLTSTVAGQMSWDQYFVPQTITANASYSHTASAYNAATAAVSGMSFAAVPAGTYLVTFNTDVIRDGATACACVVRVAGVDDTNTERRTEIPASTGNGAITFTLNAKVTLAASGTLEMRCKKDTGGSGFFIGKRTMTIQRTN